MYLIRKLVRCACMVAAAAPTPVLAQSQDVEELEPIVVSPTRTEQAVSRAPASVSVISGEELRHGTSNDLPGVLRRLPGVSLSAGSQGRPEISLRGMDSSYTLILVDGKRINSREAVFRHNDYDLSALPVDSIERIEVVRGGMSALYGSEALGGVINIITRDAAETWTGSITVDTAKPATGRDGLDYNSGLRISGPLVEDTLYLTVTGGYSRRQPWRAGNSEVLRNDDGSIVTRDDGSVVLESDLATVEGRENRTIAARLTLTPTSPQTLNLDYGHQEQERFGEYFIRNWGKADSELVRDNLAIEHEGQWWWGNSQLRAYGERSKVTSDGSIQTNRIIEGNVTRFLGGHAITASGETKWLGLRGAEGLGGVGIPGDDRVRQSALFLQDDYAITERLDLLLGARVDHHERFGTEITPRAYAVYALTPRLTIKGGVATGFKAPTLRNSNPNAETVSCRGACTLIGNPDLAPETSTNYEASLNYQASRWGGSVTIFQNDVDDLIERDLDNPVGTDPDGNPYFTYVNVDQVRIRGIETTLDYLITDSLELLGNYTFIDARDRDDNERLDHRPLHSGNLEFRWQVSAATRAFVRGEYIGKQRSGDATLQGYSLFDVGVTHASTDTLTLRGGILNIADERTERDEGYPFQERGRTFYLGFSADF